jgi:hypothetical protein
VFNYKRIYIRIYIISSCKCPSFFRNNGYDRLICALFLVISLIQFTEFLLHAGCISPDTGGRLIYLILWLQVTVFAIGIEVYFHTVFTACWAAIFSLIFIVALFHSFDRKFDVTREYGHLVWTKENENGNILGSSAILYMIGPFLIIQYYKKWSNIPIWIILAALILSFLLVRIFYHKLVFSSLWCYSAIGVLFTTWLVGAYRDNSDKLKKLD